MAGAAPQWTGRLTLVEQMPAIHVDTRRFSRSRLLPLAVRRSLEYQIPSPTA